MNRNFIDKLAFIFIKDKKILVTLSKGKDTWYLPGGKREQGESDIETLAREVKEELALNLIPDTIKFYGTFEAQAHEKPKGTIVRMTCYMAEIEGDMKPSAEIEKLNFFDSNTKEPLSPVDYLIFDDLKSKKIIR